MNEISKLVINFQNSNKSPLYSYEYGNLPNVIPAVGDEIFIGKYSGKVIRRVISYRDETVFIVACTF